MQRPVCWRTRLHGHHRDFELARGTGENLVHWPARQPPESVRDGVDTRRLVPLPPPRFIRGRSSRGRRREPRDRALEGAFVQGRQDPSRGRARVGRHRASACPDGSRFGARSVLRGISPTGWDRDLGVWAILVRRSRALGGVPRCAVVFPRVSSRARAQLRDPPRDLVSRPRPSLALPRVFPRGPVRAVEFHPVCTAFAPARHRTGRTSTVSVTASGTPAHAASFSPIRRHRKVCCESPWRLGQTDARTPRMRLDG